MRFSSVMAPSRFHLDPIKGSRFIASVAPVSTEEAALGFLADVQGELSVTRYFGGVKLGVGGLIRAYGGCAGKALDATEVCVVIPQTEVLVDFEYGDTAAVEAVIGQEGLVIVSADYAERVQLVLEVPCEDLEHVRQALVDRTGGRIGLPGSSKTSGQ